MLALPGSSCHYFTSITVFSVFLRSSFLPGWYLLPGVCFAGVCLSCLSVLLLGFFSASSSHPPIDSSFFEHVVALVLCSTSSSLRQRNKTKKPTEAHQTETRVRRTRYTALYSLAKSKYIRCLLICTLRALRLLGSGFE